LNALWLSGRFLFLFGYHQHGNPMGREFGFDLTLMSSVGLIIALVVLQIKASLF
jgi:hypothetical protein